MRVRFLAPAQMELDEAYTWYEKEQKGLVQYFIREILDTLKRIVSFPESCHFIAPHLRRCIVKRFTYMVIYGRHYDEIVVLAIRGAPPRGTPRTAEL
jgi:plasmid stabilization system protein ParE